MECTHCDGRVNKETEHFELHHHQEGSEPVLKHTFCSPECLRERVFEGNDSR